MSFVTGESQQRPVVDLSDRGAATDVAALSFAIYWTFIGPAGLAGPGLLAGMTMRRLPDSVNITLALGLSAVVAAAFLLTYQSL